MNKADKYNQRAKKANTLLCVGLDSDVKKIPERFQKMEFPQFEFNKWIINETNEFVSAYKPNSAFYEARGDQGLKELKMTIEYLQKNYPDIFTILDAKRADIGNTNHGYVTSIFDWLGFDAVTINPYLGREAVQPFLDRKDNVSIILCKTSNPGGGDFQDLEFSDKPLWKIIAETVYKEWNINKNCMLVLGATYPKEMKQVRDIVGDMTFLVPGIGAQGGSIEDVVRNGITKEGLGLIINSGRAIIFSENPKQEAKAERDEINTWRMKTS